MLEKEHSPPLIKDDAGDAMDIFGMREPRQPAPERSAEAVPDIRHQIK
jgi:hypothetical protein